MTTTAPVRPAPSVAAPLIPRDVLFGNPSRTQARLSADGRFMSWLAPDEGVLNVWVAPVDDLAAARAITQDRGRGVRNYGWGARSDRILYVQDRGGDENFLLYAVDVATGEDRLLTDYKDVRVAILGGTWDKPDDLIIGLNDRDARWHDVHHLDLRTGDITLIYENTEEFSGFVIDHDLALRLGSKRTPEGGSAYFKRDGDAWVPFFDIGYEDDAVSGVIAFAGDNHRLYALDSVGRDTAALVEIDVDTGARTLIAADDRADVAGVMRHPTTHEAEAYAVNYLKTEWTPLGDAVTADLAFLREALPGEVAIVDRTKADDVWIVANARADASTTYHLYTRAARRLDRLFTVRPELDNYTLAPMRPVEIPARDGLNLVSYLTLPPGLDPQARPETPLPLVLNVHGGPRARDVYGFDPWHQWLANRGYAVLSVNYRASTGFGKGFITAGDGEWGRKMHDDLLDAVDWAVAEGFARRDQVAIVGGSYGGYATLVGLAFTPEVFTCGVSIVGPSNLETLMESIPPYWESYRQVFARMIGDKDTDAGRALLRERSPLHQADRIARPLLIGQGANDPRVKQAESDQIVAAMDANGLPVTYILFPDEGHGFARPENRLAFYAVMEAFLAAHLGGRREPAAGAFAGSSLTAKHGAEHAPGLAEALEGHEAVAKG